MDNKSKTNGGTDRQVLLPAPKESNTGKKASINIVWRIVFCILFFILGFNFSLSAFFSQLPWFGYHTIIEVLISSVAGLFGYFIFPILLIKTRQWVENLITDVVRNIVSAFWEQQSKRIQEARRVKQKSKAEEEERNLRKELENAVVIDTSVLIDGRITDLLKTGFFDRTLVIPQEVINELHIVSDSKDTIKRQRGRRGLDVVKEVKKYSKVLFPQIKSKEKEVDKQLVIFAKEHKLKLMTLDFNLNKVASVSGIKVLNINDLINALKSIFLPGEVVRIKIIQEGKEKNQGVGYLDDGTMVVVEEAKSRVGEEIDAKVVKTIQSSAGRIIFCESVPAKI